VEKRFKELKVTHIYQNCKDKAAAIEELAAQYGLSLDEICYMGDDLPDLPVLKRVGLASCPSDAVIPVKEVCRWISSFKGGKGAVRELTDYLIEVKYL
jgi:3-deoxy-D-manno-octulosonate 8-phosphate phosphatase (KDO 8-P phosphatase)